MGESREEMRRMRAELNDRVLASGHLGIKRFFALDHQAYEDGALPARTKELLGLCASLVLRCDACVGYHIDQCLAAGFAREEIIDALNVGLVVGGSIVIPHLRKAVAYLEQAQAEPGP
jgi:ribonuclease HI